PVGRLPDIAHLRPRLVLGSRLDREAHPVLLLVPTPKPNKAGRGGAAGAAGYQPLPSLRWRGGQGRRPPERAGADAPGRTPARRPARRGAPRIRRPGP